MKASCIGPSQPVDLEEKVIRFLTDRDNDAVTGVRRVSRDDTVDMVVDIGRGLGIIISIYPEIPDLSRQRRPFHGKIEVTRNRFETFDEPILYAKSVDEIIFKDNQIVRNQEYQPWHPNQSQFAFNHVHKASIEAE